MVTVIGWVVALYAAVRLLSLPLFLPRRPDGGIDTGPFVYVSALSLVGVLGLAGLSLWLYRVTALAITP